MGISTKKAKITEVRALRPDSKGITCVVKLVGTLVEVEGKPGRPSFFEITCGDSSARVVLSVTESQKEGLHDGKVITVRNGSIKMVKGHMRLCVDKWGKLDLNTAEGVDVIGS